MTKVIIEMSKIVGSHILAGAGSGKQVFADCVAATNGEPSQPTVLLMDFAGIEVATASALRESAVALKNYKRMTKSNFYPALANTNKSIEEEVEILMNTRNDAIISCNFKETNHIHNIRLIGNLDPKQSFTYNKVLELNGTDAGSLMKKFGKSEKITNTTAWNNRLTNLVNRGILIEVTQGRSKFYRPLIEEKFDGC